MQILIRITGMAWRYRTRLTLAYLSFLAAIGFSLSIPYPFDIAAIECRPEGVQHLLMQGHLNGGCKGTLGEILTVESTYRQAIETALGEAAVSLIVEETDQALRCIEVLKSEEKGSVTFFPMDRFSSGRPEESDLDLLVVEREVPSKVKEMARLREAVGSIGVPVDILVCSEQELEDWGHLPGTVLYWALKEGEVLYEAAR